MIQRLRTWWQARSGVDETPFDGDTPAWLVSLVFHMGLLILLTVILRELPPDDKGHVELVTALIEPEADIPQEFFMSQLDKVEIGANSQDGVDMAAAFSQIEQDITELDTPEKVEEEIEVPEGQLVIDSMLQTDAALQSNPNMIVQGAAGTGTTGAKGAIDRITQEIIDSLEERKTLVAWIFDQSISLSRQREAIHKRLDRIYEELGVIEASGDPRFAKHHDKPLLSSVVAFGERISFRTPEPTDQLPIIKSALAGIENDGSGQELVFTAVFQAAEQYKKYAVGGDRRNVMLIVFTDEAGDDAPQMLDRTVGLCRRYVMPVYVVGIPSPFGRREVDVKWIDPDPNFDQTPQWTTVAQGPESLYPERVKLHFSGGRRNEEPLDSGFGPFALTRLAVDTGGIYFSVHPNRDIGRPVTMAETAHLSAYIKHFFDPDVMRRYRPDYVGVDEYKRLLRGNKAKMALVKASTRSWVTPVDNPRTRFPRKSEAELATNLTKAQQKAAKFLAGTINQVYADLKDGEKARQQISRPRWQAGYDLAMGRVLAAKIRAEGYNLMLAQAKGGLKFKNAKNDTWELKASSSSYAGSGLEKQSQRARQLLQRVIDDHPGTPWAMVAAMELEDPMGWEWHERFTNVNPPPNRAPGNNNNNRPRPRDDQKQMLQKKPKREPPKI